MAERWVILLKKPSTGVRVVDGAVLPDLSSWPGARVRPVVSSVSMSVDGESSMVSPDMLESMVQERLASAKQQMSQQLGQLEAQLRQQVDAERTAVEAERAALASAASALERAAADLADVRQRVLAEAEREVMELAVEMARTVLHQEVDAGRYDAAPIIQAALSQLPEREAVTVTLNPTDFSRCGEAISGDGRLQLRSDATVPPAGCRVECGQGVVEADPAKQLDEIRHTLLTEMAVGRGP
ncbi:MAG: flagellar assembly protein FliH [Phycisphaerae bacterium]|nr:flagellar assembly protein FliH [Phycisphaerae bacterium]